MSSYDLVRVAKVFDRATCLTILFYFRKMSIQNDSNVKLSNSQLNKLKSGIKNSTKVTLKHLLMILMMKIIFRHH